MEKETLEKNIGKCIAFDADDSKATASIPELAKYIAEATQAGATHLKLYARGDAGEVYEIEIQSIMLYEESEEAYQKRVDIEKGRKARLQEEKIINEIRMYNRLRSKYEK